MYGLCVETEEGPAINVSGGQLNMTLNGRNAFVVEEGPAIRVTRSSVTGDYIDRFVTIYGDENAELIVETESDDSSAIGGGKDEMAGSVSIASSVKGEIRGGLYAIGGGNTRAEYGCYRLSVSSADVELSAGKRRITCQEMMLASTLPSKALWSGELSFTMTYPTSNVTYQ